MEVNEDNYFDSYADLQIHKLMLEDTVRNKAYKQAIIDNSAFIKGKTVLDVGAGTGILSVFCAQAGAAKVYAVEASDTYKLAEQVVSENGFSNIIEVIHCKVEDLVLPGDMKVDILVSEWMGFYLLHEGMLDSVIIARDKFMKEDGLMLPESATIYASPCSVPTMYSQWDNVEGISMASFAQNLRLSAAHKPQTTTLNINDVIAVPETVFWFDLRSITLSELDSISLKHVFVANKSGLCQGVALWFTCTFPSSGTSEPVILSTDPDDPPTHWKQTIIVLPNEMEVEKEEPIALNINLTRAENSRRYNIELSMLDPDEVEHPPYCPCHMTKCILFRAVVDGYQARNDNN